MCIHSDLNVQTPLICHNLNRNSQSEIIVTVVKLPLPFSQSSHPHLHSGRVPIFTPTLPLYSWGRKMEEFYALLLLSNGTAPCLNLSIRAASSAGAAFECVGITVSQISRHDNWLEVFIGCSNLFSDETILCMYNISDGVSLASIWESVSPFSHSLHSPPTTKLLSCTVLCHYGYTAMYILMSSSQEKH